MNTHPKTIEQKFNTAAKLIAVSFYASFIFCAVLSITMEYLETKWEWLLAWRWFYETIFHVLMTYAFLALVIGLLIPFPLILIFPALGNAWLRGMHRTFYTYKPWREVSDGEAFLSLLGTLLSFFVGLMVLYQLVINGVFGQTLASLIAAK